MKKSPVVDRFYERKSSNLQIKGFLLIANQFARIENCFRLINWFACLGTPFDRSNEICP